MIDVENFASDWLVSNVILRESRHTPYRYILTQRKFKDQSEINNESIEKKNYLIDLINSGELI